MWVYQVRRRWEQEGSRESLRQGGYRVSRIAHLEETIRGWIAAKGDLTLAELVERLAGLGVTLKIPALWHQLNKWGLRYKKTAARQRAGTRRRAAGAGTLEPGASESGGEVVEIH
jgi:transposase